MDRDLRSLLTAIKKVVASDRRIRAGIANTIPLNHTLSLAFGSSGAEPLRPPLQSPYGRRPNSASRD
jgi:hypothetical protein